MSSLQLNRRPLKVRETSWAKAIASYLTRVGIKPNHVSYASLIFAALSGVLLLTGFLSQLPAILRASLLILAGGAVLARGVCNMLDGMIALEGGKKEPAGEIYNELPDRFSDAFLFVSAGYATNPFLSYGSMLGWLIALLAVLTAYVRALGGAAGASQNFSGPMGKTRRIYLMSAACFLSAGEVALTPNGQPGLVMSLVLIVIGTGCVLTILVRTRRIIRELELVK